MREEIKQGKVIEFRRNKDQDIPYYNQGNAVPLTEVYGGDGKVDELLRSYIEKVDRDQDALRTDIRESEKRIDKTVEKYELRMDNRLDRIEEMINEQNKKFDELKEKVSEKLEDDKKYRHTNNIAIVIGVVTTVLAMIGIYYATISSITNIIGALK
ncbi:MAG: hypothetical protein HFG92_13490 [Dorea sp.]|jgi:hypothetical protein|nr:hypothetical protein [Dorea sp.]